jgi:3-hydroxyacyl-CoA dehydrogenase
MAEIRKAAVIGAGAMGATIAAHIANAGIPVRLFDMAAPSGAARNAIASGAIQRLLTMEPAPLMHRRNAELIAPACVEDDLSLVADCDWVVEAIIENIDAKRALYAQLEQTRRPGSIVSSNTSTIRMAALLHGLPDGLARDFLITHFFNPPRYLRLVEVVTGPATRPAARESIERFLDHSLGKTVVVCKDTPGFIANRIGIYWLQCAVGKAIELGLTVEEADALMGPAIGAPKSGVFGLLDMTGIDLMPHVLASMTAALAEDDPFHDIRSEPAFIAKMIAEGRTGRKASGGFYRLRPGAADRIKEAMDLVTGEYRATRPARLQSLTSARRGLRALLEHGDRGGAYAAWVMLRTLSYCARLLPEIADDIVAVDEAMRLGYNWKRGPFEIMDEVGVDWLIAALGRAGLPVPPLLQRAKGRSFYRTRSGRLQHLTIAGDWRDVPRRPGVLLLSDIRRSTRPLARNPSASLWDIGDGVLCLEFHSKMNSLDPFSLAMIAKALRRAPKGFRALVLHNDATNFSVGANIGLLLVAMKLRLWLVVGALVRHGQRIYQRLKYASFPVVAAPSGMALGGGCEALLHCSAVQAHAETYIGLVETGVGVVPAWGGCKELLARRFADKQPPFGPMPPVTETFRTIGMATVSKSAAEAKDLFFLRRTDGITMNLDRLLADAKWKALELAKTYAIPERPSLRLPGRTAAAALTMAIDGFRRSGKATAHDTVVGGALARVLSGGDTDVTEPLEEEGVLALERRAFLELARHPATRARVAHMLKTGKPLRN